MRWIYLAAAALVCSQSVAAETIERRAPADPRGEVQIGNTSGDVRVMGWDRAEVQATAQLSGSEQLEFARDGARTIIQIKAKGRGSTADLLVHVPRASSLTINTVSADQTISEVRGAQRLQAVSGSIVTEVWEEDLEAKTVSGEISVQGHGGAGLARLTTVSGDVRVVRTGRELDLNTVSGDMDVSLELLARGRIKTTNGDLDLIATLAPQARVDAESINGDLRFDLEGKLDAQFDIETFNGDIDNCFGPKARRTREFGPGLDLRFKEGEGSARLRIKTLNGDVEVCRK